ncbi:hypothetical protein SAMD00023353_1000360 [Rosellinia necatrix]|uniref:Uncharacterized protein n=1 Tax=Rosellinia necatrix TaxID=77044 RepID=A0A1S8A683_ROSNE|nr:hypothetical protein SAMD00023353_1000360 [Rosellinia necatrix]
MLDQSASEFHLDGKSAQSLVNFLHPDIDRLDTTSHTAAAVVSACAHSLLAERRLWNPT